MLSRNKVPIPPETMDRLRIEGRRPANPTIGSYAKAKTYDITSGREKTRKGERGAKPDSRTLDQIIEQRGRKIWLTIESASQYRDFAFELDDITRAVTVRVNANYLNTDLLMAFAFREFSDLTPDGSIIASEDPSQPTFVERVRDDVVGRIMSKCRDMRECRCEGESAQRNVATAIFNAILRVSRFVTARNCDREGTIHGVPAEGYLENFHGLEFETMNNLAGLPHEFAVFRSTVTTEDDVDDADDDDERFDLVLPDRERCFMELQMDSPAVGTDGRPDVFAA